MPSLIEHDNQTKQLYTMLRRSAKTFASGYVNALRDTNVVIGEQEIAFMIMKHIDRILASLAEQFGIDWTPDDRDTIELDIREVAISKYKPF